MAQASLIITMGVSGSGKSTLAQALAKKYRLAFLEADDFHSDENKAHMAAGKPLTDAMREPWIGSMCDYIKRERRSCVLAYSGLRRAHREAFRHLGLSALFLHLHGSEALMMQRMQARQDHFMPASLLDSQFEAMEPAHNENDIVQLDISATPSEVMAEASACIDTFLSCS